MSLNHYELTTSENRLSYEFFSDDPRGEIMKVAQFTQLRKLGDIIYNLGFGDYNEESGEVDDLTLKVCRVNCSAFLFIAICLDSHATCDRIHQTLRLQNDQRSKFYFFLVLTYSFLQIGCTANVDYVISFAVYRKF